MNKHDKANLDFILSLDSRTRQNWFASISEDDRLYALELIDAKYRELDEQATDIIDNTVQFECNLTEAQQYLKRFMLK